MQDVAEQHGDNVKCVRLKKSILRVFYDKINGVLLDSGSETNLQIDFLYFFWASHLHL